MVDSEWTSPTLSSLRHPTPTHALSGSAQRLSNPAHKRLSNFVQVWRYDLVRNRNLHASTTGARKLTVRESNSEPCAR
jgi:hypothetical protein